LRQTAGLLAQRLHAWKHAVVYLEEYMEAIEKIHKAQAKEYERALKVPFCSFPPSVECSHLRITGHLEAP
jgi:hypothetical protein